MQAFYYVYILSCEKGRYYTGYSNDLAKRYQKHLAGKASKFTRSFKPVCIAQAWTVETKSLAMKMENFIKKLSKVEKIKLVSHPEKLKEIFLCDIYPLHLKMRTLSIQIARDCDEKSSKKRRNTRSISNIF